MYADTPADSYRAEVPLQGTSGPFIGDVDDSDDPVDPEFVNILDALEGSEHDSVDLYAVLGVSRTCSQSDLRAAYRRLSLLLHPDKHSYSDRDNTTSTDCANAEVAFGRISSAYAVLSDPNKRAIYDNFGFEALQLQGWQLASSSKSAAELRLEYLLLKQKALESKQLQLTQPSSEFSLGLDMTDLFDRHLKEPPNERTDFPVPSIYELSLAQSVTAGVNLKNSVSLAGQVTTHNGLGVGTGLLIWRHHCSAKSLIGPASIDTELSYGRAGKGLGLGFRARRSFGQRFTGSFGLSFNTWYNKSSRSSIIVLPGISAGLNIQLLPRTFAHLELRLFADPGVSSDLVWSSANDEFSAKLSGRLSASGYVGLSLRLEKVVSWAWLNPPRGSGVAEGEEHPTFDSAPDWTQSEDFEVEPRQSRKGTVFCSAGFNTTDIGEFVLGTQCHVSAHSRLAGQIRLSFQRGVTLKLCFFRGTQTYSFPFILSEYPDKVAIGYGLIVPVLIFAALRNLVYEPYLSRQLKRAQKSRRIKLQGELAQRRREAISTQCLMLKAANRSRDKESLVLGLIIDRAMYGLISSSAEDLVDVGGPLTIDVTTPLQTLVENSQLLLPPGRWSDLQGFYDPCVGLSNVTRQLRVLYTFQNSPHEVTVNESQGLAIPMAKHKLDLLHPL